MFTKTLCTLALSAISLSFAGHAFATDYPEKPTRIVVPYNAGGAVDYVGRVAAAKLSEQFGQNFVVENRPGASAAIGIQFVKNARPDGYTLMFTSLTSNAITMAMESETIDYDLKTDFQPVGIVAKVPLVLVVNASLPVSTMEELVAYAKTQPQPLAYASSGIASTEHLGALSFARAAGLELRHIPYTGGAPAMTDVAAGRVPLMVATLPTALSQIAAGNIKALAVAGDERIALLPDVPTATEVGLDEFSVASIYSLLAPANIDPQALTVLRTELGKMVNDTDFEQRLVDRGIVPNTDLETQPEVSYFAEIDRWHDLVAAIEVE